MGWCISGVGGTAADNTRGRPGEMNDSRKVLEVTQEWPESG